jgi:lactoylglutathione lyase
MQLVHAYFERDSPKAEPAATRWLVRYLTEGTPEPAGRGDGDSESCGRELDNVGAMIFPRGTVVAFASQLRLVIDRRSEGCQAMSESLKSVGAITMFIEDTQRSKTFYEEVFGARVVYEDEDAVAFEFENLVVNMLRVVAAHELIAPASVGEADAPSRFQLTIEVQDTDAVCEQLGQRGVELLNGPMDREWGMRTAAFTDPDGHIWEVAAKIPS